MYKNLNMAMAQQESRHSGQGIYRVSRLDSDLHSGRIEAFVVGDWCIQDSI